MGFNARYFDRFFLAEANLQTWLKQAEELKKQLTDRVIEEAIRALPPETFSVNGEELIRVLKVRRNKLSDFANTQR